LHAVAPHLQASEHQNLELQNRLAREARHRLDQQVERAVPNYREIDQDPRWHNWLRSVDPLSGRVRQTLLDEAIASATPHRVISFFVLVLPRGGPGEFRNLFHRLPSILRKPRPLANDLPAGFALLLHHVMHRYAP
jgi:hypothetical protein